MNFEFQWDSLWICFEVLSIFMITIAHNSVNGGALIEARKEISKTLTNQKLQILEENG
jgi:hypothetical protein